MRENIPHPDQDQKHSIDNVPRTCWTCVFWVGGDVSNHLCSKYPGQFLTSMDPCKQYQLWEEWLFVDWYYPAKKRKSEFIN